MIEQACSDEVADALHGEAGDHRTDLRKRASHAGYAHITIETEGGGEKFGEVFPKDGHIASGPKDAGEEEHRHGEEDVEQYAVLSAIDEETERHGKEDTGQQKEGQKGQIGPVSA